MGKNIKISRKNSVNNSWYLHNIMIFSLHNEISNLIFMLFLLIKATTLDVQSHNLLVWVIVKQIRRLFINLNHLLIW